MLPCATSISCATEAAYAIRHKVLWATRACKENKNIDKANSSLIGGLGGGRGPTSLPLRFHLDPPSKPVSLRFHFDFTSASLPCHFGTSTSRRLHIDFTPASLRFHIEFTSASDVASISREFHSMGTSASLRHHTDVTSMSR